MIQIDKFPAENKVCLDGNSTIVSITSSNGLGFYFRAKIYINDELFDEQSWSRKNDKTAEKDLKKLYHAYFETVFKSNIINGLEQQNHLLKKVSIIVEEYNLANDILVQSLNLPQFYLMYNVKPVLFDDSIKVQLLDGRSELLQISSKGKIAVPFMVNALNETLTVELIDNYGNVINSLGKSNFSDKRVYQYFFDLATVSIPESTLYLTLKISVGNTFVIKNFRFFNSSQYSIKEIVFANNFGYWVYAYLDGKLTIENNIDTKTYEQNDGFEKVYEINEKETYTLNSGTLLLSEKNILNQICTAIEAKIYWQTKYISLVNATKKINTYNEREYLYSENLSFSVRENTDIDNQLSTRKAYYSNKYNPSYYKTN